MFDLRIELYGFDTGEGLPETTDRHDPHYLWPRGFHRMDIRALKERLQFANLVLGNINQTAIEFMQTSDFAPIGVMLIDVDYYSSTVPILNMLRSSTDNFLPRVHMFFDDIAYYLEHSGEKLAIDEFNVSNQDVNISRLLYHGLSPAVIKNFGWDPFSAPGLFCAHIYKHDLYSYNKMIPENSSGKLI